jgi:DNA-binding NarL/FixJ family response regulator
MSASRPLVLIADDHALIRAGMRSLLEHIHPDLQLMEAATAEALLEILASNGPALHTVFLDLKLPGCKGTAILERVLPHLPGEKICVLSGETNPHVIEECLARQVRGYIAKGLTDQELLTAVRQILAGEPCYAGIESLYQMHTSTRDLSSKQAKILQQLAEGRSYEDIAREMDLTVHGVHYHARNIFKKLNVKNRQQAVAKLVDLS